MKESQNDERENKIISAIIVLALILLVFGVTYAVFEYSKAGSKQNTLKTGSITLAYSETSDGIQITNALPIDDEEGKKLPASGKPGLVRGYFDFNINVITHNSTPIQYTIYGVDVTEDGPKLDSKYVKVYLTNGEGELPLVGYQNNVPTFSSLDDITVHDNGETITGKVLYNGTFNGPKTDYFRLRIWVSKDYQPSGISNRFKMKVNVTATG